MHKSIHRASTAELEDSNRAEHVTWGYGLSLEEYLEKCQRSPRRQRGQAWVLTLDGEVASSLSCLPLQFHLQGRLVRGFGLASVHTPPELRRRGYADELCRHVMEVERSSGAQVGLLFSDVRPSYYGAMGFELHSTVSHDCTALTELSGSGPQATLAELKPREELSWLTDTYREAHEPLPLALARDEGYWRYSLESNPDDRFWLIEEGGERRGYVRVCCVEGLWALSECVLLGADPEGEREASVYRSLASEALRAEVPLLTSWRPPPEPLRGSFSSRERSKAWPMLYLDERLEWSAELTQGAPVYSADYF